MAVAIALGTCHFIAMSNPLSIEAREINNSIDKGPTTPFDLLSSIELRASKVVATIDSNNRKEKGQFFTSAKIAEYMASLFDDLSGDVRILDAGAGGGVLFSALTLEALNKSSKPAAINVISYETEDSLIDQINTTSIELTKYCTDRGVEFNSNNYQLDFIENAAAVLKHDVFLDHEYPSFNKAILNPPYRKIRSDSKERQLLRQVNIEVGNLYAAFVALAIRLLEEDGELVAITPRSFCNGAYFLPFRKLMLDQCSLEKIHIYHSREKAFKNDSVLQENIIFHLQKKSQAETVKIFSSNDPEDDNNVLTTIPFREIVYPDDMNLTIHIPINGSDEVNPIVLRKLPCTLADLNVEISTGPIVDFRLQDLLRKALNSGSLPLLYPKNIKYGKIEWPGVENGKAIAIKDDEKIKNYLVPRGNYIIIKRFSSKEEKRRIVAGVATTKQFNHKKLGIDNKLNYIHRNKSGLPINLARGLAIYLNSTLFDQYFRQFSGNTQVNATDVRLMRFPTEDVLMKLGSAGKDYLHNQKKIDNLVAKKVLNCISE